MIMKIRNAIHSHTLLICLALAGLIVSAHGQAAGSKHADVSGLLNRAATYQAKGQVNQAEKVLKQALGQAQVKTAFS